MIRADLVSTARSWVGTPFVPQGALRGAGCDCAGLIIGIAKEVGAAPSDFNPGPYKQQPDGTMLRLLDAHLLPCAVDSIAPGDVVAMQWELEPQHLAIVVDYPMSERLGIVHALTRRGGVVEHILSKTWRESIVAAYRFPGVE